MTTLVRGGRRALLAVLLAAAWVLGASAAAAAPRADPPAVAAPAVGPPAAPLRVPAPAPVVGAWAAPTNALAAVPAVDTMPSFEGRYAVDREGGVGVTETISYRFDASAGVRHGILRTVTLRQALDGRPDDYRYYAMTDVSVSSPTGANTDVQLVDAGAATTIKVGSPKVAVSGTQTYVVRYHLAHVLNAFPDSGTAELYLNVFTDDPVGKARVDLQVSAPAPAEQVRCGRGPDGRDCDATTGGEPARFAVSSLASREDLTVAARYPLAAFTSVVPDIRTGGSPLGEAQARAASYAALALGLLLPLAAGLGMGALVATRGRDEWYAGVTPGLAPADPGAAPPPRRGAAPPVAVQFNPPPGVQPGLVGTIVDERVDTLDVSATVIDLAVRGWLTVEEVDGQGLTRRTDWRLTRRDPPTGETLRPYESRLLDGLFATGDSVLLSNLKNHFASTLSSVKDQMYDEVLRRGWFRSSPQRQRTVWQALGFLLLGAGAVLTVFLGALTRGVDRTAGLAWPVPSGVVLGVGMLLAGALVVWFGTRVPAKTAEGSAVLAQSLGFRQYLATAEAGQIRWEEAQSIFSRYLPYAIVFGVAERWSTVFEQVAAAAAAAGAPIAMPAWYVWHGAAFPNFSGIVSGVDSFSTAAAGTFQATPGSSGGSGFGSSGGTFSGGGVGGSSSGSW